MDTRDRRARLAPFVVVVLLAGAACSASKAPTAPAGFCEVLFGGHRYRPRAVEVAPVVGPQLGIVTWRGCPIDSPIPPVRIRLFAIAGVPPDKAVVRRGASDEIFLREGVSPLDPEVARLVTAPACDPADAPVTLMGVWLGILSADGSTEVDLVPPYNITLRVSHASLPRYLRATITILVPLTLGRPLTHADVQSSLWKGGTISTVASCEAGTFVAEQVHAMPPA